ncbi:MAG: hypothetical protein AAB315_06505, partial [Pseudomonadota bacterium]
MPASRYSGEEYSSEKCKVIKCKMDGRITSYFSLLTFHCLTLRPVLVPVSVNRLHVFLRVVALAVQVG